MTDSVCCFRIDKWREYQHYSDRRPPWIKLHAKLIDNRRWRSLTDTKKAHLLSIWMLAARLHTDPDTDAVLPYDSSYLADLTGCRITDDTLQTLMDAGFIARASTCEHDASDCGLSRASVSASVSDSASVSNGGSGGKSDEAGFDTFWDAYPRKVKKLDAEKAWKQTRKDRPPTDEIVEKVGALAQSKAWREDGGKYVPYPASWLRAGGWDDEVESVSPRSRDRERAMAPEPSEGPDPF